MEELDIIITPSNDGSLPEVIFVNKFYVYLKQQQKQKERHNEYFGYYQRVNN